MSLENDDLEADALNDVLSAIEKKLGRRLTPGGRFGADFAALAAEFCFDEAQITLGWDNWSGIYIMSWDDSGDRLIENEIADIFIKSS